MPLPAGLEAMDTEETVCKVCGVSYLVYREIKALEKKIKGLEAEIKEKSQAIEAANTASHLPRFCFVVTATNRVSKNHECQLITSHPQWRWCLWEGLP